MIDQVDGRAALRASHRGMVGMEIRISTSRWMTLSTQPPKYPERPPSRQPRMNAMDTPTRPTLSEMREATMIRERTSRPSRSVPSR